MRACKRVEVEERKRKKNNIDHVRLQLKQLNWHADKRRRNSVMGVESRNKQAVHIYKAQGVCGEIDSEQTKSEQCVDTVNVCTNVLFHLFTFGLKLTAFEATFGFSLRIWVWSEIWVTKPVRDCASSAENNLWNDVKLSQFLLMPFKHACLTAVWEIKKWSKKPETWRRQ